MSTYWHLRCTTCDDRNEDSLANSIGPTILASVLVLLPHFKAIASDASGWIDQATIMGTGSEPIFFAIAHSDHDLVIESEYGDIYDHKTGIMTEHVPA